MPSIAWYQISWLYLFHNYKNELFQPVRLVLLSSLMETCFIQVRKEFVSTLNVSLKAFKQFNRINYFEYPIRNKVGILIIKYAYSLTLHCVFRRKMHFPIYQISSHTANNFAVKSLYEPKPLLSSSLLQQNLSVKVWILPIKLNSMRFGLFVKN